MAYKTHKENGHVTCCHRNKKEENMLTHVATATTPANHARRMLTIENTVAMQNYDLDLLPDINPMHTLHTRTLKRSICCIRHHVNLRNQISTDHVRN